MVCYDEVEKLIFGEPTAVDFQFLRCHLGDVCNARLTPLLRESPSHENGSGITGSPSAVAVSRRAGPVACVPTGCSFIAMFSFEQRPVFGRSHELGRVGPAHKKKVSCFIHLLPYTGDKTRWHETEKLPNGSFNQSLQLWCRMPHNYVSFSTRPRTPFCPQNQI